MPEPLKLLCDQNIPMAVAVWLRSRKPSWTVHHVNELGFAGQTDDFLYRWARDQEAIVITYDEDF